jgi:peptide deformylase
MAILDILHYPDPRLKEVSPPITSVDQSIKQLIADLCETLDSHSGCVGIASPQTGNLKRLIVIDASRNRKPVPNSGRQILLNPTIARSDGLEIGREGCLSLPDFTANVMRAMSIVCRAMNEEGKEIVLESTGFEARVILHEIDHLDGLLFLDRVTSLKSDVFRRKTSPQHSPNLSGGTTTLKVE